MARRQRSTVRALLVAAALLSLVAPHASPAHAADNPAAATDTADGQPSAPTKDTPPPPPPAAANDPSSSAPPADPLAPAVPASPEQPSPPPPAVDDQPAPTVPATPEQPSTPPPAADDHPAPAVPPEPKPAAKEPAPPKNLEPIPKPAAISILGKKVKGPGGEDMGRVVDLLLDRDARPIAVVIDFGGFLGVGSRKIAIDWRLVRFVPDDAEAPVALGLGKSDVQAAPEYKDSADPPVMVGPPPSGPDAAR